MGDCDRGVHVADRRELQQIQEVGVRANAQGFIHLTPLEKWDNSAVEQTANLRVTINVTEMVHDGMLVFKGRNGLLTTSGFEGIVPKEYVKEVVDMDTEEQWTYNHGVLEDHQAWRFGPTDKKKRRGQPRKKVTGSQRQERRNAAEAATTTGDEYIKVEDESSEEELTEEQAVAATTHLRPPTMPPMMPALLRRRRGDYAAEEATPKTMPQNTKGGKSCQTAKVKSQTKPTSSRSPISISSIRWFHGREPYSLLVMHFLAGAAA